MNGTLKLWDADSGQELFNLKRHFIWVTSLCFSPDGQRLASAGGEPGKPGEVKVWDAGTGQELRTLEGGFRRVSSVCFSPDGQRLASADEGFGGEEDRRAGVR